MRTFFHCQFVIGLFVTTLKTEETKHSCQLSSLTTHPIQCFLSLTSDQNSLFLSDTHIHIAWEGQDWVMTKKRAPSPIRHLLRFCSKLIIFLSVLLCLFAFLRLHFQPKLQQLFSTSRTYRRHHHFEGPPKIAFLFLVRRNLPLDFLWGAFFKVSTYFLEIKWEAIKTKQKKKKKIWIWKSIKFKKN